MTELAKKYLQLERKAFDIKAKGKGSEPAWAEVLGLKGDPYEVMANTDEVMRPVDLLDFVALVLNPDVGMCADCRISKEEQSVLKEETERMKYLEGLHIDENLKLHHGFITRGSCFDFIYVLD